MRERLCGRVENKYLENGQSELSEREDYWILARMEPLKTKEWKMLDVGCGGGFLLSRLSNVFTGSELYGIDVNELVLSSAKKHVGANFILSSAERLPFVPGSFNAVVCKNLLHHLVQKSRGSSKGNARSVINEMNRVLEEGGYLLIIEQCVGSKALSYLIFLYTRFLSIASHEPWSVSLLTPEELYEMPVGLILKKREIWYSSKIYKSVKFARVYIIVQKAKRC